MQMEVWHLATPMVSTIWRLAVSSQLVATQEVAHSQLRKMSHLSNPSQLLILYLLATQTHRLITNKKADASLWKKVLEVVLKTDSILHTPQMI